MPGNSVFLLLKFGMLNFNNGGFTQPQQHSVCLLTPPAYRESSKRPFPVSNSVVSAPTNLQRGNIGIEHRKIGFRPIKVIKSLRRDPGDGDVLVHGNCAGFDAANKRMESYGKNRIMMCMYGQSRCYIYGNFHFFPQFAVEAFLWRLSGFNFAAGKLPLVRQTLRTVSLGSQYESLSLYDGACYVDVFMDDMPFQKFLTTGDSQQVPTNSPSQGRLSIFQKHHYNFLQVFLEFIQGRALAMGARKARNVSDI